MGYIYCITNKINGKRYVGQTKHNDVNERIKEHFQIALSEYSSNKRNLHLYNSIRKYGKENFEVTILKDNLSEDELDEWEVYFIKEFNTYADGYNNTVGGGGVRGYRHTDETKKKIGQAVINNKDKIFTEERAKKISFALKGRTFSKEHKEKISENAKKRTGERNPFYGKHHSKETNEKNSIAHRKYTFIQVDLKTNKEINRFGSIQDVCDYIHSVNLSKAKDASIAYRIYWTVYGKQKEAYGYGWIGEKCNDYPSGSTSDDELPMEVHSSQDD